MNDIGLSDQFESKSVINLSKVDEHLNVFYARKWQEDVHHVPKLRTYRVFKTEFKTEEYVKLNMYKNERSIMCQFRSGVLPLRIETGRFIGEKLNQRVCRFCNTDVVEDEKHFLFHCALYNKLRTTYSADIFTHDYGGTLDDKLVYAMTNHPRMLAKFLVHAYLLRRKYMYK